MTNLTRDVVYALRQIVRRPGQPLIIVLSLGIALGINTTLFSFVNATWFAPWDVHGADRVRIVRPSVSPDEWRYWSDETTTFSGLAATQSGQAMRLNGQIVRFEMVSANYFQVLGVPIHLGREFARLDDGNAAVISHHLWQTHYGGDADIIGRTIALDPWNPDLEGLLVTVIGVAAPGFDGPQPLREHLWLPLSAARRLQPAVDAALGGGAPAVTGVQKGRAAPEPAAAARVMVFGRLASGVSDQQAQAELATLNGRFRAAYPELSLAPTPGPGAGSTAAPAAPAATQGTIQSSIREPIQVRGTDRFSLSPPPLQTQLMLLSFLIGATFITLIACANVANLLLARGHARRGEIAVRLALGAGRGRLVRQLLIESFMMTLVAAWLGLMMAWWLPEALLRAFIEQVSPDFAEVIRLTFPLDRRVFAWVLATAMVACVAFGLAPALRCTEVGLGDVLKETHGNARTALLSSLIGYQTIVSVMALAVAGFLLRSGPLGVTRGGQTASADVTIVRLDMPRAMDAPQRRLVVSTVGEQLRTTFGEERVAGMAGQPRAEANQRLQVTPGYFTVAGIPWVAGRTFAATDLAERVMVVNEAFARRFWPGRTASGQTLSATDARVWDRTLLGREVIGVVGDAQLSGATAYLPAQAGEAWVFLVRAPRARVIREAAPLVARLRPSAKVAVLAGSTWLTPGASPALVTAYVTMAFGGVALLLGMIGFFSLLEYAVRQRTREIGIRRALGAQAWDIMGSLLAPASRAVGRGLAIGTVGACCLGVLMRRAEMPASVNPFDPLTYAGVAAALAVAGLLAASVPARRALRIAPSVALRVE